jgi:hypothetical protein
MTEPTRLRDEGPEEIRALLRHAPKTLPMTADQRARSRARVARTAAAIAAGAGSLAWLQGAAVGAGLGVLTVGAAQVLPPLLLRAPSAAPSAAPAVQGTSVLPAPAPAPAPGPPPGNRERERERERDGDPPLRPPPRSPEPPASSAEAASPPPQDSLGQEAALLERARSALAASPAEALALTEAHAAQFPSGKLATERELVAIDALRRLGRTAEARARGDALLVRARGGLYEERIRKLLDGMR